MPRRGYGGRFARARPASRAAPSRPAPQPVPSPIDAESNRDIGSTIVDGMAFGAGIAVAHRVLDYVFGPRTIQREREATGHAAATPAPTASSLGSDACNVHSKAFQDCLNSYENNISKCQSFMDKLAECRRNSGATSSA